MKHLHVYIAGFCSCGATLPSYAQSSEQKAIAPTRTRSMSDQHLSFDTTAVTTDGTAAGLDTYDKSVLTVIAASLAIIAAAFVLAATSH